MSVHAWGVKVQTANDDGCTRETKQAWEGEWGGGGGGGALHSCYPRRPGLAARSGQRGVLHTTRANVVQSRSGAQTMWTPSERDPCLSCLRVGFRV